MLLEATAPQEMSSKDRMLLVDTLRPTPHKLFTENSQERASR